MHLRTCRNEYYVIDHLLFGFVVLLFVFYCMFVLLYRIVLYCIVLNRIVSYRIVSYRYRIVSYCIAI